jgi:hypothetical protein
MCFSQVLSLVNRYKDSSVSDLEIDNDVFVLDSTSISVSMTLMNWAIYKN